MDYYMAGSERKALEFVYRYMQLDFLTNPECNFVSEQSMVSGGRIYNRGNIPESFDDFRRQISSLKWEALMCVAGTDKSDRRRVVLLYMRDANRFAVNFPNPGALNGNETKIKEWIEREISRPAPFR